MRRPTGIAFVAALIIAAAAIPAYHLTVIDDTGRTLWTVPVESGAPVTLVYENSIYRARTEELLTVTPGGFTLHGIRSRSEAVLAYNGFPAPYAREGDWYTAEASGRVPTLVLRIGHTGRQRLLVGDRVVPLYDAGEGAQVRVGVARLPRAVVPLRGWLVR